MAWIKGRVMDIWRGDGFFNRKSELIGKIATYEEKQAKIHRFEKGFMSGYFTIDGWGYGNGEPICFLGIRIHPLKDPDDDE